MLLEGEERQGLRDHREDLAFTPNQGSVPTEAPARIPVACWVETPAGPPSLPSSVEAVSAPTPWLPVVSSLSGVAFS